VLEDSQGYGLQNVPQNGVCVTETLTRLLVVVLVVVCSGRWMVDVGVVVDVRCRLSTSSSENVRQSSAAASRTILCRQRPHHRQLYWSTLSRYSGVYAIIQSNCENYVRNTFYQRSLVVQVGQLTQSVCVCVFPETVILERNDPWRRYLAC